MFLCPRWCCKARVSWPSFASLIPQAWRSMCGWIGNGILAASPRRWMSLWKPMGLIGPPRRALPPLPQSKGPKPLDWLPKLVGAEKQIRRHSPRLPFTQRPMSADVGGTLLSFGGGLGLRRKREDSCVLPFIEPRQQHDVAVGELERVMIDVKRALVDLAKDRNGVAGIGSKHEGGVILDWFFERQFGARKYADSHRTILRRGESSRARTEVVCDEFFAHLGWACLHRGQTVVAHKGTPHVGAPP